MHRKSYKKGWYVGAGIAIGVVALLISLFSFNFANAAANYSSLSLDDRAKYLDAASIIHSCYDIGAAVQTNYADVDSGALFYEPGATDIARNAMFFSPNYATKDKLGAEWCSAAKKAVNDLATKFGFKVTGSNGLVCTMGYKDDSGSGNGCGTNSKNFKSFGGIDGDKERADAFETAIKKLTGIDLDKPDKTAYYVITKQHFLNMTTCTGSVELKAGTYNSLNSDERYAVLNSTGVKGSELTNDDDIDENSFYTLYGSNQVKSYNWGLAAANRVIDLGVLNIAKDTYGSGIAELLSDGEITCEDRLEVVNDAYEDMLQEIASKACSSNDGSFSNGSYSGNSVSQILRDGKWATASTLRACILGATNGATICASTYTYKDSSNLKDNIFNDLRRNAPGTIRDLIDNLSTDDISWINNNLQGSRAGTYKEQLIAKYAKELEACKKGATVNISDERKDAEEAGNKDSTGAVGSENVSSCVIEGIGWIICPVITFMASVADASFIFLANSFLRTDPQVFNTNSDTYKAWSVMRSIANVAFVIIFLIIIFSQLTSMGVSNYGVKKMLPRLLVAAILVNLSYFICQVAIDLSNILGYSIKDAFGGVTSVVADTTNIQALAANPFNTGSGFAGIAGAVITSALVGVALYSLLSSLIPILLAAVIALVVILFILIARQAIIVLLIVISPLAFVAFLLPNTEGLFKQWRKMLTAMLLLFPIIALVYGASELASQVLAGAFAGTVEGDSSDLFGQIAAAAILTLPLFAVPVLLKKSLDGIPVLGQLASKYSSRANANIGSRAKESYNSGLIGRGAAIRKQARHNFYDKKFSERLSRGGVSGAVNNALAGGVSTVGGLRVLKAQKDALKRAATGTAASAQSEAVKQEMALLQKQVGTDPDSIAKHMLSNHGNMNDVQMEAASDLLLAGGGVNQYRSVIGSGALMAKHARSLAESGRRNDSQIRPKAADIANWLGTAGSASQVDGYSKLTVGADGKTFIQSAYENAEAGKLLTMDPGTAKLAENYINPTQAELAINNTEFGKAKAGTQEVLVEVYTRPQPKQ